MSSSPGLFVRGLSFFVFLLPRSVLRGLGTLLGVFWFDVLRFRRQIVLNNLAIAFPEKSLAWKIRQGRRSVIELAVGFFEFFALPRLNRRWLRQVAVFEGREHLDRALSQKKGVLVLTLHMGPADVAASILPMNGYPASMITKFFKTEWFNNLWFSIRGAQGLKLIEAHGERTPFDILKALKKNSLVIFVLDQFMGKPYGVATRFFGKETGTAYGLALFALKTKAPVVPIYSFVDEQGRIHLRCLEALDLTPFEGRERDEVMVEMTQMFNNVLENVVRAHPDQWMWIHRRWKEFE